jgi:SAM-dependent methyltransferase
MAGTVFDPRLIEHRRVWERKPALRLIYTDYHRQLLAACPPGPVLDVGGGSAHIKETRSDIISIDILPFASIDAVCDAHRLPFARASFASIIMLDVLHHLDRPLDFLKEAARVLRPGGVLAMIEPGMTAFSYPFYRYWHQEPADLNVDPFETDADTKAPSDPFDSNQAIPTLLFARDQHIAELGRRVPEFAIRRVDWLGLFAYPLSGGFQPWCLVPASAVAPVLKLESALPQFVCKLLGFRIMVILSRRT